jgi:hypothetical protein
MDDFGAANRKLIAIFTAASVLWVDMNHPRSVAPPYHKLLRLLLLGLLMAGIRLVGPLMR